MEDEEARLFAMESKIFDDFLCCMDSLHSSRVKMAVYIQKIKEIISEQDNPKAAMKQAITLLKTTEE